MESVRSIVFVLQVDEEPDVHEDPQWNEVPVEYENVNVEEDMDLITDKLQLVDVEVVN